MAIRTVERVVGYFGNLDPRQKAMHEEVERLKLHARIAFSQETETFVKECQDRGLDVQGQTILIQGIGPGTTLPIWARLEAARVIGIDTSEFMLQEAHATAHQLGLGERFEAIQGKAEDMDSAVLEASVQAVEARLFWKEVPVVEHSPLMAKITDVLVPGGGVVFEDFVLSTWREEPGSGAFREIISAAEAYYQARGANMDMGESLASLCEDAGLRVVHESSYARTSRELPEIKQAQLMLLGALGRGITHPDVGLMTPGRYAEAMREEKEHLSNPSVVIYCPTMVQVYAVLE